MIIIAGKNGWPTAKALAQACLPIKARAQRTINNNNLEIKDGSELIIRWGDASRIMHHDGIVPDTRNSSLAICRASDKALARFEMIKKGVPCPKTFRHDDLIRDHDFPVIGRPRFHHGGKDVMMCHDHGDVAYAHTRGSRYFSSVFPKTAEFRVHCAGGKVLIVQDKNLVPGEIVGNQAVTHRKWNTVKWGDWLYPVCIAGLKAVDALGLDFGAADVMYDARRDKASVCEVNTAPSLDGEYEQTKYANYFKWCVLTQKNRQKWDFTKFKKVESLAWKEDQFKEEIPQDRRAQ